MKKEYPFKLIDGFRGKKICVIGDLMLDHFIFGDARRISPEAPVPVVLVEREIFAPGGAGNVAANIAALGGKARVMGRIGSDTAGLRLMQELKQKAIECGQVLRTKQPTIQKARVIAGGQQIVRVDYEKYKEPVVADVKPAIASACRNVDIMTPNFSEAQTISKTTAGLKEVGRII